MTKTIAVEHELSPAELRAEYNRLALLASQGDKGAEKQLVEVETRIESAQRAERRKAAAEVEHLRVVAQDERQAAEGARQAAESAYRSALLCRRTAYALVEDMTADLAAAVEAAIVAGDAARGAAMRLGYSAGRMASSELTDFVAWKLGRLGAGLSDMPTVLPAFRQPLVQHLNPKES